MSEEEGEAFLRWIQTLGHAQPLPAPVAESAPPEPPMPKPDLSQGGSGEEPPVPADQWLRDLLGRL